MYLSGFSAVTSYADSGQILMWLMKVCIFFTKLDIGILSIFLEVCCNHLNIFEGQS